MIVLIFIFGCCWGSFIGYLSFCLVKQQRPQIRVSYCDHCRATLRMVDKLPIFGYLILGGHCYKCGKSITWAYLVLETISGVLACIFLNGRLSDALLFFYVSTLLIVAFVDYHTMVIYDITLAVLAVLTGILLMVSTGITAVSSIIGCCLISGIMILVNMMVKESFGEGDIKLMALAGVLLGVQGVTIAAVVATIAAGIAAVGIKLLSEGEVEYLPFAPFLCAGIIYVILR